MESKHTKGEWKFRIFTNHVVKCVIFSENGDTICKMLRDDNENSETELANAQLITAAPIGLQVAINTYISILQTPSEIWRIKNQLIYIELREFISKATGYKSQYIQEFYEQVALLIKHQGVSQEEAIKQASSYEYNSKN
jgi:hypothetical protein